jgi:hypothetical protein
VSSLSRDVLLFFRVLLLPSPSRSTRRTSISSRTTTRTSRASTISLSTTNHTGNPARELFSRIFLSSFSHFPLLFLPGLALSPRPCSPCLSFSPIGALVWTTAFFTDSNYIFLAALDSSGPQNVSKWREKHTLSQKRMKETREIRGGNEQETD